jgi:hypothetical protein
LKLSTKRHIDSYQDQIEACNREILHQKALMRAHRDDKEVKIVELSGTIRILSSKSDMHRQLAIARHELESEKSLTQQLKADVESYR